APFVQNPAQETPMFDAFTAALLRRRANPFAAITPLPPSPASRYASSVFTQPRPPAADLFAPLDLVTALAPYREPPQLYDAAFWPPRGDALGPIDFGRLARYQSPAQVPPATPPMVAQPGHA